MQDFHFDKGKTQPSTQGSYESNFGLDSVALHAEHDKQQIQGKK